MQEFAYAIPRIYLPHSRANMGINAPPFGRRQVSGFRQQASGFGYSSGELGIEFSDTVVAYASLRTGGLEYSLRDMLTAVLT